MEILNQKVEIPWKRLEPGMSFFVPCLDSETVSEQLKWESSLYGYSILCKQVIERGRYGLRCWRVK